MENISENTNKKEILFTDVVHQNYMDELKQFTVMFRLLENQNYSRRIHFEIEITNRGEHIIIHNPLYFLQWQINDQNKNKVVEYLKPPVVLLNKGNSKYTSDDFNFTLKSIYLNNKEIEMTEMLNNKQVQFNNETTMICEIVLESQLEKGQYYFNPLLSLVSTTTKKGGGRKLKINDIRILLE